MRIEKSIVFDENELTELTNIANWCNEARNFFTDEGAQVVRVITHGGHPVGEAHLRRALDAVSGALVALHGREPHQAFPADLKARYEANLLACIWKLGDWLNMVVAVAGPTGPQGALALGEV